MVNANFKKCLDVYFVLNRLSITNLRMNFYLNLFKILLSVNKYLKHIKFLRSLIIVY